MKKTQRVTELVTYAVFYIFITVTFLVADIPIVLIAANLTAYFCLTFNYESPLKKRIFSVISTYLILTIMELMAYLLSGALNFYLFTAINFPSIYGLIVSRILSFLAALILNNFKNIRKGETVPNSYWLCIVLIPASSLYIVLLLFQAGGLSAVQVFAGIAILFLVNFTTFYLYDVITAAQAEKMQNLLVLEQNKYYDRQLETMRSALLTTRAIRHDLKNHMISIKTLVENGDTRESLNYISEIMNDIGTRKDYSASGNTVIDSIINFKFQEAEQRRIITDLDLEIPDRLEMPTLDMTVILGNLLDNAIKAASKVEDDPFIRLKMRYDKGRLMIQLANPYIGEIIEQKGDLVTTEEDKENHGFGLQSIKKVIQRYDGTMDIDYSNNLFSITLLLYLD